jgi:hypothetical protein
MMSERAVFGKARGMRYEVLIIYIIQSGVIV